MIEKETNKSMIEYNKIMERREMVKGLTCHHKKDIHLDDRGRPYWMCEKNNKECMIEGQCPKNSTKERKTIRQRLKVKRRK